MDSSRPYKHFAAEPSQPTLTHGQVKLYCAHILFLSTYVFITHDSHRGPLQRQHTGPYKVIKHGQKSFHVNMGTREELISINQLNHTWILIYQ